MKTLETIVGAKNSGNTHVLPTTLRTSLRGNMRLAKVYVVIGMLFGIAAGLSLWSGNNAYAAGAGTLAGLNFGLSGMEYIN